MAARHGIEEYLEAIYVMQTEGVRVIPSKLADYLGVARPTVTQTVRRMQSHGHAARTDNHEIKLTQAGREVAEAVVRRHRLIERWLSDELGLDWAEAHVEAGRLEHAISPLVEQRLWEHLGHPKTCPHGNIIPGSEAVFVRGTPLQEIAEGCDITVVRILEQAEEDLELLRFLHQAGIVPGAKIIVERSESSYEAGIQVRVGEKTYALTPEVSARVLVTCVNESGESVSSPKTTSQA